MFGDKKSLSETEIRTRYITPSLVNVGWSYDNIHEEKSFTDGRVIDTNIKSMVEFKQIIGRGTRISEELENHNILNIPELSAFGTIMEIIMTIFMGLQNFQKALEDMKTNLYSLEA